MNFNKYLQFLLDIGIRQFPRTHYPLRTFVAVQVTIHHLGTSSGAQEARVKKYQLNVEKIQQGYSSLGFC